MEKPKCVKIPKNDGSFRNIYIPTEEVDKKLKNIIKTLNSINMPPYVCAFHIGRNILNYIKPHLLRITTKKAISVDIYKCFDSITKDSIIKALDFGYIDNKVKKVILDNIDILTYNNFLPQGYRTSPVLCNLVLLPADDAIIKRFTKEFDDFVYTRYADNILLSSMEMSYDPEYRIEIVKEIDDILKNTTGLRINRNKIKLYPKFVNGYCKICGVSISKDGKLKVPRRIKHMIRGLEYLSNKYKTFSKHKLNGYVGYRNMIEE
ncbi:MAG: reverse transcriptase domain-containing protein [candidate division WOR-3 bacterium]